jgi:hypothetical protein
MRLNWKLILVRLDTVLILIQDRCTVCTERTVSSEIIFDAPMDLLGDMGHVESRFGPFVDSVSLGARWINSLHQTYHSLRNHYGRTRWNS